MAAHPFASDEYYANGRHENGNRTVWAQGASPYNPMPIHAPRDSIHRSLSSLSSSSSPSSSSSQSGTYEAAADRISYGDSQLSREDPYGSAAAAPESFYETREPGPFLPPSHPLRYRYPTNDSVFHAPGEQWTPDLEYRELSDDVQADYARESTDQQLSWLSQDSSYDSSPNSSSPSTYAPATHANIIARTSGDGGASGDDEGNNNGGGGGGGGGDDDDERYGRAGHYNPKHYEDVGFYNPGVNEYTDRRDEWYGDDGNNDDNGDAGRFYGSVEGYRDARDEQAGTQRRSSIPDHDVPIDWGDADTTHDRLDDRRTEEIPTGFSRNQQILELFHRTAPDSTAETAASEHADQPTQEELEAYHRRVVNQDGARRDTKAWESSEDTDDTSDNTTDEPYARGAQAGNFLQGNGRSIGMGNPKPNPNDYPPLATVDNHVLHYGEPIRGAPDQAPQWVPWTQMSIGERMRSKFPEFDFSRLQNNLHTLVLGPTGAGKTSLLKYMYWNLRRYYDMVILISRSEETISVFRGIIPPAFLWYIDEEEFNESIASKEAKAKAGPARGPIYTDRLDAICFAAQAWVKSLTEKRRNRNEERNASPAPVRISIIFDDFLVDSAQTCRTFLSLPSFSRLLLQGRPHGIGLLVLTHKFNNVPTGNLGNFNQMIVISKGALSDNDQTSLVNNFLGPIVSDFLTTHSDEYRRFWSPDALGRPEGHYGRENVPPPPKSRRKALVSELANRITSICKIGCGLYIAKDPVYKVNNLEQHLRNHISRLTFPKKPLVPPYTLCNSTMWFLTLLTAKTPNDAQGARLQRPSFLSNPTPLANNTNNNNNNNNSSNNNNSNSSNTSRRPGEAAAIPSAPAPASIPPASTFASAPTSASAPASASASTFVPTATPSSRPTLRNIPLSSHAPPH